MALTRVAPAGIGSTPGTGYVIGDSFLHSRGLNSIDANYTGIVTTQSLRVIGDLEVEGTTTTLDTDLIGVDRIEVAANSTNPAIAVTQSGSGAAAYFNGGDVNVATGNIALASATPMVVASNGSGHLRLGAGGSEKVRITSNGNVGIGSAIPTDILDIQTGSSDEVTKFKVKTAGQLELTRNHISAPYIKTLMGSGNPNIILGDGAGDKVLINGDGSSYFNGGNVGIGTDNPTNKLDVNGDIRAVDGTAPKIIVADNFGAQRFIFGYTQSPVGHNLGSKILADGLNIGYYTRLTQNGSHIFYTNNSGSDAERLRITSDGRIGIGMVPHTSSTGYALQIDGGASSFIQIFNDTSGNTLNDGLVIGNDANTAYFVNKENTPIVFRTNNTERLRITSDGAIAVGDASQMGSNYARISIDCQGRDVLTDVTDITKYGLAFHNDPNTNDANGIGFFNDDGTNCGGYILHQDKGSNNLGDLIFGTSATSNNPTERLRIKSDGNVGVGDDNPDVPFNVKAGGASFAGQTTHVKIEDTRSLAANVGGLLAFEGVYNSNGDPACYAMIHGGKTNADNGNYAGYLRFFTRANGSLPAERLRITSAGNVGIGENNPTSSLVIKKSNNSGVGPELVLNNSSGSYGDEMSILFSSGGTPRSGLKGGITVDGQGSGWFSLSTRNPSGNYGERIRISSAGRVGIATDSPDELLEVGNGTVVGGLKVSGQSASITDEGITFDWVSSSNAGRIFSESAGDSTLKFYTTSSGTRGERLRILSNGRVAIGGITANSQLDVHGGDGISITSSGDTFLQSRTTGTTGTNYLEFKDAGGGSGAISYHHDGNSMRFKVSGSERLRISSDGKTSLGGSFTAGATLHIRDSNNTTKGDAQLKISKGVGSDAAPTSISRSDCYIHLGGSEWGNGGTGIYLMGLGYTNGETGTGIPAYMGYRETTSAGYTYGDLVFGTRGNTTGTNNPNERLRITSAGNVGINNTDPQTTLNVQGTISTGRNLAREVGTVISYSSQFNSSRSASNVINGKKNYENGNNDWLTPGNNRDNAWVVIDLGAQYNVDRIVIYNQNEYSNSKREVKRFNLEGSNDNSSWTLLIDDELGRSEAHEPNPGFSFRLPHVSNPGGMQDDNEGVSYRYWKFHMKDFHDTDPYGGIMEIELYEASDAVESEVSTHSMVASDVYTQTLSAQRLAIGENGALGDFHALRSESIYINGAARFGQNTADSSGNATRHTGWRMYGYNPAGISARYQWTQDGFHGRKSFYYYFPNGSANQAIRFHSNRSSFWTCGFITINALYSHQNASGMLRYHFQHNANGTASYGKTIDVDVNIGNTSGNFGMSNNYTFKTWGSNGGSSTSHALELRHLTSTGNGVYVTFEMYGNHMHNHMDDLYMTTGHTY